MTFSAAPSGADAGDEVSGGWRHRLISVEPSALHLQKITPRILPQIIFKGHVLRQEPLCKKGMYFICPGPVYQRIITRLGGTLRPYHQQPGSLTFRWYDLGDVSAPGQPRALEVAGQMTTTVDQIALVFTPPQNLPQPRVYEEAIRTELGTMAP
ncbi:MAG: hypothetical protein ABMA13_04365 [Chthoniobacteraceae bacterium]